MKKDNNNCSTNDSNLILAKCGFCCNACPTLIEGACAGCMEEHKPGDCFTRDCVIEKGLNFCGECGVFPCDDIISKPRCTVLDKDWLRWKKETKRKKW